MGRRQMGRPCISIHGTGTRLSAAHEITDGIATVSSIYIVTIVILVMHAGVDGLASLVTIPKAN